MWFKYTSKLLKKIDKKWVYNNIVKRNDQSWDVIWARQGLWFA